MPPNPVTTGDADGTEVAPNGDVLPTLPPPKLLGADVVPKLVVAVAPKPPVGALGELNPVEDAPNAGAPVENPAVGVGVCIPPLLATTSFSCVRPKAAIPNTAPMAMWNSPAPCSVSGIH